jgi:hypothetical protein
MLHIRAVSPPDVAARVVDMLDAEPRVFNLIVLPAAARNPDGDAIQFDVLTASANDVLAALRGFGLDRRGSIAIETVETSICDVASATSRQSPLLENAPVWEEVDATIRSLGTYPPSFYGLLVFSDIGVSSAVHSWHEALGSLLQLLLNVGILILVGSVALQLQRRIWRRLGTQTAATPPGS